MANVLFEKFQRPSKVLEQILSVPRTKKGLFIESKAGTGKSYGLIIAALQNTHPGILGHCNELQTIIFCATFDAALQTFKNMSKLVDEANLNISVGFASKEFAVCHGVYDTLVGTPNDIFQVIEHLCDDPRTIKAVYFDDADAYLSYEKMTTFIPNLHEAQLVFVTTTASNTKLLQQAEKY